MKKTEPILVDGQTALQVAELFRAFSDASRVRILSAILDCELNVSALADMVGVTRSAVSHHSGLRRCARPGKLQGKEVYYSVVDPHIVALIQQGRTYTQ
jgi:hypothetical protein